MGPGMFDGLWEGLVVLVIILMLVSAGIGACGMKMCQTYKVRVVVEKVEKAPK